MNGRLLRIFLLALALAVALGVLPAASRAAGAKPHIAKHDSQEKGNFQGGVVKIFGENFSDALADVKAFMDEAPCTVVSTVPEMVIVVLPQTLKPGNHHLAVEVAGERSNAVDIKILPWGEHDVGMKERVHTLEGDVPLPTPPIRLDPPVAATDRGAFQIMANGKADYPDDAQIFLELRIDTPSEKLVIDNATATVTGGIFHGLFGPYTRQLFAGNYAIEAHFDLARQPGKIRNAFRDTFKKQLEFDEHKFAFSRMFVRVGSVGDEEIQTREEVEHFSAVLKRVRELLDEMETGFASAGRSIFRDGAGKMDEDAWADWAMRWSFAGMGKDDLQRRLDEARKSGLFLAKDGTFDDKAWREWLDFKWREDGLAKLVHEHVQYCDRFLILKNNEQVQKLVEVFATLSRLSQVRSNLLYTKNNRQTAAEDAQLKSKDLIGIGGGSSAGASRQAILQAMQRIGREVGLDDNFDIVEKPMSPEKR